MKICDLDLASNSPYSLQTSDNVWDKTDLKIKGLKNLAFLGTGLTISYFLSQYSFSAAIGLAGVTLFSTARRTDEIVYAYIKRNILEQNLLSCV